MATMEKANRPIIVRRWATSWEKITYHHSFLDRHSYLSSPYYSNYFQVLFFFFSDCVISHNKCGWRRLIEMLTILGMISAYSSSPSVLCTASPTDRPSRSAWARRTGPPARPASRSRSGTGRCGRSRRTANFFLFRDQWTTIHWIITIPSLIMYRGETHFFWRLVARRSRSGTGRHTRLERRGNDQVFFLSIEPNRRGTTKIC